VPPSLTVVMPSLNGASRIEQALDALDAQTIRAEIEIIIVDDGSADATAEVARRRGATVIRHEHRDPRRVRSRGRVHRRRLPADP
jgi:glycosyltransferase involved in cell wall biosynthesis